MKSKFIDLAYKISLLSPSKYKVGCVLVKGNRVISFGFNNMTKTHPKSHTFNNFIHAETHALINLKGVDSTNSIAYVYRAWQNGKMADSKPCAACELSLRRANIKVVYYSTIEGIVKEEKYGK